MYALFPIGLSDYLLIPHVVLKSGTPRLPEDKLDHDGITLGPSDPEFEADEVEKCEETGEEALALPAARTTQRQRFPRNVESPPT